MLAMLHAIEQADAASLKNGSIKASPFATGKRHCLRFSAQSERIGPLKAMN